MWLSLGPGLSATGPRTPSSHLGDRARDMDDCLVCLGESSCCYCIVLLDDLDPPYGLGIWKDDGQGILDPPGLILGTGCLEYQISDKPIQKNL